MSVLFTSTSPDNPVKKEDAQLLLNDLGLTIAPEEVDDFHTLLAAVHDCAEDVSKLPDYQPVPDISRYPRQDVRRPGPEEQVFGQAWAHRFLIEGNKEGGSLAGKTVSLKDCIAVAGVPQLLGSDVIPSWTPTTDATVVKRLLDAGVDILGTSTCENFCHSTGSYTSAQGTVENPHAAGYSAGGSTSGGAALVAGGVVDITIGGDQGGSIRVPASFCGCVGLKPTHGLVPFTGITSGDAVNDHAGPLARSVQEVALCLDAISRYDGIDDRSLSSPRPGTTTFAQTLQTEPARLEGFNIGVLKEGFEHSAVDPTVRSCVMAAVQRFKELGAVIEEISLPEHLHGPAIWTIQQRIAGSMSLLGHAHGRHGLYMTELDGARLPWTDEGFQRAFPATKNVIINGLYLASRFPGLYGKTMNIGRRLRDLYENIFENHDVVVMPTTPVIASRHGKRGLPLESVRPSMGLTINTAIFDVTGQPAMSIPVGFASAKDNVDVQLPVGMQIVGGLWQDSKVLRAGHAWETNFDWKDNRYTIN
ncbi:putative amidase [Aspergillus clavatus NRRL 1]|uniref:Amidase, putative n=1 Tax=Aspergillus clavatus (strain ATCC 1007 / CBS 513.65 / DSM 816 / NCTC 3887 / NRRL 1 / QM 1276 / 107) TaxID=344612 RepID=A1CAE8_ASPCL|nr:amidase, putative [Aspergillus clavatus NRRL 1]EAW12716.1 amidase, putative [Aspergillus clavatus NRRL 1]